jgi:hypothetical protein
LFSIPQGQEGQFQNIQVDGFSSCANVQTEVQKGSNSSNSPSDSSFNLVFAGTSCANSALRNFESFPLGFFGR